MAGYIGSKASVVSSGAERKKTFTITGATTSLTGLNYTVGKVHVFQNGVRLVDGTDYTATNGTTITLTVAAQNGDNVVVISQAAFQVSGAVSTSGDTMTGDLTVQGTVAATAVTGDGSGLTGTGSPSIDDNGNATALTIDSSESVLIGKTATGISAAGHSYKADGTWEVRRDISSANSSSVGYLSRGTTDGNILTLYKDTTSVGSIGAKASRMFLYSPHGSGTGIRLGDNWVQPSTSTGANNDAVTDLGFPSSRFKDAYLSGGVYLGGTAATNKLDDYEEGTWTPILGGSTTTSGQSYATQHGSYTKIGRVVHLQGYVVVSSIGTTSGAYGQVQNLPFTAAPVQGYGGGFFQYFNQLGTNVSQLIAYAEGNTTFAYVLYTAGAGTVTNYLGGGGWGSAPQVMFSMTYLTNS